MIVHISVIAMENSVRLIVKASNQQIEDQVVACEVDWTIERLKNHLSEVYPSRPNKSEQKLIYSGHLLKDTTCLKDVLRNYEKEGNNSYIVHLVCATSKNMSTPKSEPNTTASDSSPSAAMSEENGRSSQNTSRENSENVQSQSQQYSVPGYYGQLNNQQIAWMQQAYAQYLSQYMQIMAAQGVRLPNNVPYIQATNFNQGANPMNANNRENEETRAAQDPPEVANNEDEDGALGGDRDWLESIFLFLRVLVLVSIVYFYSSPLRFLIVTLLGIAIHLYRGGFPRVNQLIRGEENVPLNNDNNIRPENNPNQPPQNDAQQTEAENAQNEQQPANTEPRINGNEANETERPGALAFTWMFFTSFFASLIPDQPNVI